MLQKSDELPRSHSRLFLHSLIIANFATVTLDLMLGFFLIDISSTFQSSLGATSQTSFFNSAVGATTSVILTFLSIKMKQKSLVIIGLFFMLFSGVGIFFAPTLELFYLTFSLQGIASVIVGPMALVLIAEKYPSTKISKKVGYLVASAPISNLIVILSMGFIVSNFGWRYFPLFLAVPSSLLALILVYIYVPSTENNLRKELGSETYLSKIKNIYESKSAIACLIGNVFRTSTYMTIILFGISFYRQSFSISINQSMLIMIGGTLSFAFGNLISSNIISRIGIKQITIVASGIAGILIMAQFSMPHLWMALPFDYLAIFFSGIGHSAATSFTLAQVPKSRPTLMSLNATVTVIGMAITPAIGGRLIDQFSFAPMGLILGFMGVIAAMIFSFANENKKIK